MKLEGTCVVVTGGAGGIGKALARRFLRGGRPRGRRVRRRQADALDAVAAEIGAVAEPCAT